MTEESQDTLEGLPVEIESKVDQQTQPQFMKIPVQPMNQMFGSIHHQTINSPYLPPEYLEKYNQVLPGSVEQIFALVQKQQEINMEVQRHEIDMARRNMGRQENIDSGNIAAQSVATQLALGEQRIKARGQNWAISFGVLLIATSILFAYWKMIWLAAVPLGLIVAVMAILFLQKLTAAHQPKSNDEDIEKSKLEDNQES
jgi:uncharacterized membrane protein